MIGALESGLRVGSKGTVQPVAGEPDSAYSAKKSSIAFLAMRYCLPIHLACSETLIKEGQDRGAADGEHQPGHDGGHAGHDPDLF